MWRSRRPKGRSSSPQSELRWNRTGVEEAVRHRSGEASKRQRGPATGRRTKQRSRQSCTASRGNNTKTETKLARFWGTRQEVPTRRWLALHDRDWPRFRDRSQSFHCGRDSGDFGSSMSLSPHFSARCLDAWHRTPSELTWAARASWRCRSNAASNAYRRTPARQPASCPC